MEGKGARKLGGHAGSRGDPAAVRHRPAARAAPAAVPAPAAALALAAATLLVPGALRATVHIPVQTSRESGVTASLTFPFDRVTGQGFLPVEVELENRSTEPGTWVLEARGMGVTGEFRMDFKKSFTVEGSNDARFLFLLPMEACGSVGGELTGPGVTRGRFWISGVGAPYRGQVVAAVSSGLATVVTGRERLNRFVRARFYSITLDANPRVLPGDWRAYTAFDHLYFTPGDWLACHGLVRDAVLRWVYSGGVLGFLIEPGEVRAEFAAALPFDPLPSVLSPSAAPAVLDHGLGEVWFSAESVEAAEKRFRGHAVRLDKARRTNWRAYRQALEEIEREHDFFGPRPATPPGRLPAEIGKIKPFEHRLDPAPLNFNVVILAVVAFGILVGPFNFLVLARGERRYRVYYTTPLISLGASFLLGGYILLAEGTGGRGIRHSVSLLVPGEKGMFLFQAESTQSGLVVDSDFSLPEGAFLRPGHGSWGIRPRGSFGQGGRDFWGDWYRSRSLQSHFLTAWRPTRSKVQLVSADPAAPALLSAVDAVCPEVFYVDPGGRYWRGEGLALGGTVELVASSSLAFDLWWRAQLRAAGRNFEFLHGAGGRPGFFYASAVNYDRTLIPTLPSIRWETQGNLILGPVEEAWAAAGARPAPGLKGAAPGGGTGPDVGGAGR